MWLLKHLAISLLFHWKPHLGLLVKARRHQTVTRTAAQVANRLKMTRQLLDNATRGNVPHHDIARLLRISEQVLITGRPCHLGLTVAIILVTIQVTNLSARRGIPNDIARRVRGGRQVLLIVTGLQVENAKGNVVVKAARARGDIDGNLGRSKCVVRDIEIAQVGRSSRIGHETLLHKRHGFDACRQMQALDECHVN